MKITMYELLGLVKDGKAPKNARIRYFDRNNDYYDECNLKENEIINRLHYGNIELNDEVEIIEEKKIPEKIRHDACWIYDDETNQLGKITLKDDLILNKLDEIIDFLKQN